MGVEGGLGYRGSSFQPVSLPPPTAICVLSSQNVFTVFRQFTSHGWSSWLCVWFRVTQVKNNYLLRTIGKPSSRTRCSKSWKRLGASVDTSENINEATRRHSTSPSV